MNHLEKLFTQQGGTFCIPIAELQQKMAHIRAFIFDWDGVFNDGIKNEHGSSSFSEVDAMGTNLLRFSNYLKKKKMPIVSVMSGERNVLSFQYGRREHVHSIYFRVKNKRQAFEHFLEEHQLKPQEVAFVFDDVLDLSLAEVCGVRILVNQRANPLLQHFITNHNLADYSTANPGGRFAVREACELMIGLQENFDITVQHRLRFSTDYAAYYNERQQIPTSIYTWTENVIERAEMD
jgi:3-deoxy-D-manno-octulosonate 8-phosphate phosphatase (KDO 8-P phosphatase)